MKPIEDTARGGLPDESKEHGLAAERLLTLSGPYALCCKIRNAKALAAAPDPGGVVECHGLLARLDSSANFVASDGDNPSSVFLNFNLLKHPNFSLSQAITDFVFQQSDVIFWRSRTRVAVVRRNRQR
jgi:hypothetical protein